MTSSELLSELRALGPQDFSVMLTYIGDRLYELRLRDGRRVTDVIDCKQLFRELAEASRVVLCLGYPKCDGDLIGEPHEPECEKGIKSDE